MVVRNFWSAKQIIAFESSVHLTSRKDRNSIKEMDLGNQKKPNYVFPLLRRGKLDL